MSIDYFVTLFVISLALVALLFFVFFPLLEGKWLKNWYKSQRVDWVTQDGLVLSDLQKFVVDRYVNLDTDDAGSIKPRKCDSYAHPFLFTDSGQPLMILVNDDGKVTARKWLKYSSLDGLRLREFQTECINSIDDWEKLFVSTKEDVSSVSLSRLKRYDYTIRFEELQDKSTPQDIPTTAMKALMMARAEPSREAYLTFVFTDKISGKSWKFQLPEYVQSPFYSAETLRENDGDLFAQLPEYALDRSSMSKLKSSNAQGEILFLTGTDENQLVEIGNPCWNKSLNKIEIGNFPVNLSQFSNIYLRGLQHVSPKRLDSDDEAIAVYRRLFWSCTLEQPSKLDEKSSITPLVQRQRPKKPTLRADRDENELGRNLATKDVLLELKICQEGTVFDVISAKCVKSE